jgi:protein-S-isoprenylcysteine O-methyltransferase Ste14
MQLIYRLVFPALWLSWALYWFSAAHGAKVTARREPIGSRLLHVLPLMAAALLLWSNRVPVAFLNRQLFPWAPWEFWVAALVTAAGLGFAVWARLHLGRNWSGTVTIKQDHELIMTGPYALARHPIYTGLLLAFAGTALARNDWRGVLAWLLAWAALWFKLGVEERWMGEQFGKQYEDYRRQVPALVPLGMRVKRDPESQRN